MATRCNAALFRHAVCWTVFFVVSALALLPQPVAAGGDGGSSPVTWLIIDNRTQDFPVSFVCPDQNQKMTITSTDSKSCGITPSSSITFSGADGSCKAVFDSSSQFDPASSTCKPAATGSNTLVFSPQQGVTSGVSWTFLDDYPGDWANGGVKVQCPSATQTITSAASVSCLIPANGTVTFTGPLSSCTAKFDSSSQFDAANSTCVPQAASGNTLTFPATTGITPQSQILAFIFPNGPAGITVACDPSPCPSSVTSLTNASLILDQDLTANGALTLTFTDSSASTTCNVSLYNQFVNNNATHCENVSLQSMGQGYSQNSLSFPSAGGPLVVYPKAPKSKPASTKIGTRTLTFDNQCDQAVWFSLVSGTVGPPPAGTGPGGADANACANASGPTNFTCPFGTTCRFVNDDKAFCFYDIPSPGTDRGSDLLETFMLDAAGTPNGVTTNTMTIPVYEANDIVFSGGASARVGCQNASGDFTHCAIGNCNDDDNALGCGYTTGTSNGATIAEFTFQKTAIDFYDVSVINGAHIPISMGLTSGQTPDSGEQGTVIKDYWCTTPGSATENGKRACGWDFSANLPTGTAPGGQKEKFYFVNVTMPDISNALSGGSIDLSKLSYCAKDSDCTSQSCGLSYDLLSAIAAPNRPGLFTATGVNGKTGPFTCGDLLGFNTPVNICSLITQGADGYFNCNTTFSQTPPGGTSPVTLSYTNMYSCNGSTDNCIKAKTDYTNDVCCGCTVWSSLNLGIKSGQVNNSGDSIACTFNGTGKNTNSYWDGTQTDGPDVEGKITFLKQACPTAYAYQFDDATSTFNCYVDGSGGGTTFNDTSYTITFCPNGTTVH